MHQAISETGIYETPLTHVVCPNCNSLVEHTDAGAVGDIRMNLVMGYMLYCSECKKESLLIYAGHPPLLDLDVKKVLIVWKAPEV